MVQQRLPEIGEVYRLYDPNTDERKDARNRIEAYVVPGTVPALSC